MLDEVRPQRFVWLREGWANLTSEQQLGVSVFSVCGLLTLIFSGWYLHAQIQAPFLAPRRNLEASRQLVNQLSQAQVTQDAQRVKDTDGDGLSDWDELNTYHTSPYLADSDSDGISDGVEVAKGSDPNCPQGRDCQPRLDGVAQRSTTSSGQALIQGVGSKTLSPPVPTAPADMSASDIRALLISNGLATETDLKGLSDQAVIELYRRGTQGTPSASGASPGTPPAPATNAVPSR